MIIQRFGEKRVSTCLRQWLIERHVREGKRCRRNTDGLCFIAVPTGVKINGLHIVVGGGISLTLASCVDRILLESKLGDNCHDQC